MTTYLSFHSSRPLFLSLIIGVLSLGLTTTTFVAATPDSASTAFDCSAVTTMPPIECEALVAIYNTMGGEQWAQSMRPDPIYPRNTWLQLADPCDWYGVSCAAGHVQRLFVDYEALTGRFPPESKNLTQLHSLYTKNGDSLPQADYLATLTSLEFKYQGNLPAAIGLLTNLEELSAPHGSVQTIDPAIGNLQKLKRLTLDVAGVPLPAEFGALSALEALTLTSSLDVISPVVFPSTMSALSNVKQITLRGLHTTLPPAFADLPHLELLNALDNELHTLPDNFGNLQNLRWLLLNSNQLDALPASIGNLTNLIYLDLYNNHLTTLPAEIGNLSNLERLRLEYNELQTLPATIGNLSKLNTLELTQNQLTALPPEIGTLTGLRALKLSHNQLTTLPAAIGNLHALPDLELANNQLRALPDTLGQLVNITTLQLQGNNFTTYPAALNAMPNLETLWFDHNDLTLLPTNLTLPPKLNTLVLSGNSELVGPIPRSFTQLSTFEAHFTQLCSDPDPAFQAWVQQVTGDDHYLEPCPTLTVDTTTGAPGSQFTLVGAHFGNCCVTWTVTVTVNSVVAGTFPVVNGAPFTVTLTTSDTVTGRYIINASYGLPAWTYRYAPQVTLVLDPNAPLRTPAPAATQFALPPAVIYQELIYLPLVAR